MQQEITSAVEEDVLWDGRFHSYRPSPGWRDRVSPKLELYQDTAEDLDPATFEVLRNRFWTINISHGETITRISGSPIFQALDFSMTILAEHGEIVVGAPYAIYLNVGSAFVAPYIMENFSEHPGIFEGDVFLTTDPWIGCAHQMDVCVILPVFVEGKLFGWVSNAGHQYDLGGVVPGGWPQNAVDVYSDPVVLTPFKLVEAGVMRRDLEAMYLRQSRMPDLVALDLRAQIAGCRAAAQRLQETCAEFGAPTVKAAMRRILDHAESGFASMLSEIPDGRWSQVRYLDESLPGDRGTYRTQLNVEKTGDRLVIDNAGTHAQTEGPLGVPYVNFSGGITGVLAVTMLHEHTFSIGGAERQIDFRPTPGLLNCVDYPAAVSGGVLNGLNNQYSFMTILGRMLVCAPELRERIMAAGPEWPLLVLTGLNDRGVFFGTALMDGGAPGSGARSYKDGVDTGGPSYDPAIRLPNVEATEEFYPILYLYRRERTDGGGAGRWRGGTGLEAAVTPYRAQSIAAITNSGGMAASTHQAPGLFGGYPSPSVFREVFKGTNLHEVFNRKIVPRNASELEAHARLRLRGKSNGEELAPGDVIVFNVSGGGGYGDPLDREPERVADDVGLGYVSPDAALAVYGVGVTDEGNVDADATRARREEIVAKRSRWRPARELTHEVDEQVPSPATGEPPSPAHENLVARDDGDQRVLACARCDRVLSDLHGNYKLALLVDEGSPTLIPTVGDPAEFLDDTMLFRRYCCPGCHVLMTTEIVRDDEPVLVEMRLA